MSMSHSDSQATEQQLNPQNVLHQPWNNSQQRLRVSVVLATFGARATFVDDAKVAVMAENPADFVALEVRNATIRQKMIQKAILHRPETLPEMPLLRP